MKGSFVDTRLADVPAWACGHDGAALQTVLGQDQDAAVRSLEDTVKMASPYLCADDALDACGRRFNLPRYDGEPNGTAPLGGSGGPGASGYRGRLCAAWDAWVWAGTAKAVTDQLIAYGFRDVDVLPIWQSPAPLAPCSADTDYATFYIKLGPGMGTTGVTTSLSAAQIVTLKAIVAKWKAPGAYPIKIILDTGSGWSSSTTYPIGRTWGDTMPVWGDSNAIWGGYQ